MRLAASALLLLAAQTGSGPSSQEKLAQHRNLGKAFYENPTAQKLAVDEFRKALALAPDSPRERLNLGLALIAAGQTPEGIAEIEKVQKQDPALAHSWFNLAVQFKKAGDYERAQKQFEGFVKLVPDEPAGHYNLGVLHKLANRNDEAIKAFETASKLDSNLAAPHFQLYNLLRQAGRREEATARLKRFQAAKDAQANAPSQEDMEWSWYSEILDPVDAGGATADEGPAPRDWKFLPRKLGAASAMLVFDADGDGRPDLLTLTEAGARVYSAGLTALPPVPGTAGAHAAAAGDFDNDGHADLCVLTAKAPVLLSNIKGRFSAKPLPVSSGSFDVALWLDYDHDYDLDLLLFGEKNALLRNEGASGFAERTSDFPFDAGKVTGAVAFRRVPDAKGVDVLVSLAGQPAVLYADKLAGRFEREPFGSLPADAVVTSASDVDANGSLDVLFQVGSAAGVAFSNTRPGHPGVSSWTVARDLPAPAAAGDFENRSVQDFLAGGNAYRNLAGRKLSAAKPLASLPSAKVYTPADFNGDGKLDVALLAADGSAYVLANQSVTPHGSVRISLGGIKNPKLAAGTELEIKAGSRYQKRIYPGYPISLGVRNAKVLDTVRITWPNGLIQSEASQPVRAQVYKEAQRLSGSCPQVWTWNGREWIYVTDVLGVAPLGAMAGDGTYFPVDSLEHIQLPSSMQARDGFYEVRLTEELSEVAYVDQVNLMAVDHPAGQSIYLNEKFQSPPYPDLKIYRVGQRLNPVRGMFGFDAAAAARLRKPLLVLSGWVDWADGSQFRAASQEKGRELAMPSLDARGRDGVWRTVLADMGMPAGKPKTIAVELEPAWLETGDLRIRSNLALFWTDAFLADALDAAGPVTRSALPSAAELRFRGFSRARIHPKRKEPEMFFYADPLPSSMWNPTPGNYTRFGDVRPLMTAADDRFAIMGSGDELVLRFEAAQFGSVPSGMSRSWILAVDGWAKDRDPNTAYSQTVEPLPFHGMSQYPYPAGERFPDAPEHRAWQREYNTRPALRLLRPLISSFRETSRK